MINHLIGKIKEQQALVAKHALEQPPSSESQNIQYLYGQRIGYYAGLQKALDLIDTLLKDQDEHDKYL